MRPLAGAILGVAACTVGCAIAAACGGSTATTSNDAAAEPPPPAPPPPPPPPPPPCTTPPSADAGDPCRPPPGTYNVHFTRESASTDTCPDYDQVFVVDDAGTWPLPFSNPNTESCTQKEDRVTCESSISCMVFTGGAPVEYTNSVEWKTCGAFGGVADSTSFQGSSHGDTSSACYYSFTMTPK